MQKLLTFFSAKILAYMYIAIFNDQSFNNLLTNIVRLNNWDLTDVVRRFITT